MDFDSTMSSYQLLSAASGLIMFIFMILLPAVIVRAMLGGKPKMSLQKPMRAAVFCSIVGGLAMFFAIMRWGHSRSYWPGWGVIAFGVGAIVATPILSMIFKLPRKKIYGVSAVYLVCQVLFLTFMALSPFLIFSMADGFMFFWLACLAVLPFTWSAGGGSEKRT